MPAVGNLSSITNVFVLMLENHSFDNIFAMSGIPGITAATTADCNSWAPPGAASPNTYCVKDGAPPFMTTDPGHEFADVLHQLCGADAVEKYRKRNRKTDTDYPPVTNSGYASSYATSTTELTWKPDADHIGDIMACFDTASQLPVIQSLAQEFAICDHWFSSIPGPTWPNRFFLHGASSAHWTDSPHFGDEVEWLLGPELGFRYANGSVFQALERNGHGWRLYQDKENRFSDDPSGWIYGGWISQVASLHGITLLDVHSLDRFRGDLNEIDADGRPAYLNYPYTFIEPNFGKSFFAHQEGYDDAPKDERKRFKGPTYKGGSSQHPEDDPSGGEGLIKTVYEAIRASPVWETSLLVIIYDEHGGFYDSVKPGPAVAPGDKAPPLQTVRNAMGFDFSRYGVRVPAVIVSPLIAKGCVDHTIYDHASVAATLERMLGFPALTKRDAAANDVGHLLSLKAPREDCPSTLPDPVRVDPATMAPTNGAPEADNSLPRSGNVIGFLHVLLKAELELDGKTEAERKRITENFGNIKTKDAASDYIARIGKRVGAVSGLS